MDRETKKIALVAGMMVQGSCIEAGRPPDAAERDPSYFLECLKRHDRPLYEANLRDAARICAALEAFDAETSEA